MELNEQEDRVIFRCTNGQLHFKAMEAASLSRVWLTALEFSEDLASPRIGVDQETPVITIDKSVQFLQDALALARGETTFEAVIPKTDRYKRFDHRFLLWEEFVRFAHQYDIHKLSQACDAPEAIGRLEVDTSGNICFGFEGHPIIYIPETDWKIDWKTPEMKQESMKFLGKANGLRFADTTTSNEIFPLRSLLDIIELLLKTQMSVRLLYPISNWKEILHLARRCYRIGDQINTKTQKFVAVLDKRINWETEIKRGWTLNEKMAHLECFAVLGMPNAIWRCMHRIFKGCEPHVWENCLLDFQTRFPLATAEISKYLFEQSFLNPYSSAHLEY